MELKRIADEIKEDAKEDKPLEPRKETLDYDKNNPKPMVKPQSTK